MGPHFQIISLYFNLTLTYTLCIICKKKYYLDPIKNRTRTVTISSEHCQIDYPI